MPPKPNLRIARPEGPLPLVVRHRIASLIEEGSFPPGDRLPVEPVLAEQLGVSRGTLREALRLLQEDGYIERRVGVGTFVRKSRPSAASISLERNFGSFGVLRSMGLSPVHRDCQTSVVPADESLAATLHLSSGALVVILSRVAEVGDRSVVFGSNIVAQAVVEAVDLEGFAGSLHTLLETECGCVIAYGVATLIPTVADRYLSRKLGVRPGSPLQLIEQVNYDPQDGPVFLSREYWVPDVVALTVFRNRDAGPTRGGGF